MRKPITTVLSPLPLPSFAEREAATLATGTHEEHDRFMEAWPCMGALDKQDAPDATWDPAKTVEVAAWNIERCKHVEASAALLRARKVDLVLATEMDWGCARSGQRHTTADLAAALGMGHVFGTEFVELALGDAYETRAHAGETNLRGLHGNAVLSRHPIGRVALLPLDDGGRWYVSDLKQGQRRIGGRNAIAAEILVPAQRFWAVAVHLESESTPDTRNEAVARMLETLLPLTGEAPVVIGGDFNCFALSRSGMSDEAMFAEPETVEPLFGLLRSAGFDWRACNTPGTTTRAHPWQRQDRPLLRIDWLFTKGLAVDQPWIDPALDANGAILSDHDPVGARLLL